MKYVHKASCLSLALMFAIAFSASASIVYDNSTQRGNPEHFAGTEYEFGEEIILAGNGIYTVTNFQYEFFGHGPDFTNGNAKVRLRFYQNDGPLGRPSTLLYDSGVSSVSETAADGAVLEYAGLNVNVPKNFTWTVEFTGLTPQSVAGLQSAGLDLYQIPTVGLTYDDYWEKSGLGGTWDLRGPAAGEPRINFGCRVQATYVGPPAITEAPQNTVVCPGATATFSVTAIGTPPLSYQWFKAGSPMVGETTSNLNVSSSAPGAYANYSVLVTNSAGSVMSAPASLSPESITPMTNVVVYDNFSTRETPTRFGDSDYEFGDEIVLAGSGTWNITNFKFEYYGYGASFTNNHVQLALRFYNNDGPNGTPGTLIYNSGYSIVPPTGSSGRVLEYAGLDVSVPAHFTWTVDFVGIGPSSSGGLQGRGLDLYGPPTIGYGYDDYWERSGPGMNWVLRAPLPGYPAINFGARAEATVTGAPYVTQQPRSVTVCRGDSATLSVEAIGSNHLMYQWFHGSASIAFATNSSFTIFMVNTNDLGSYTVVVDNCLGSVTSQPATVTVPDPNQSSPCLRIEKGVPGSAIVSWTAFFGPAWILQETATLNPPGPPFPFSDSAYSPTLIGSRYIVTLPTPPLMRVYRLRKP